MFLCLNSLIVALYKSKENYAIEDDNDIDNEWWMAVERTATEAELNYLR